MIGLALVVFPSGLLHHTSLRSNSEHLPHISFPLCYAMLQLSTFAVRLGVRWGLENRLARLLSPMHSLLPNTKSDPQTHKSASVLNSPASMMWGYSLAHGDVRREVGQKAVANGFRNGNGSHAANYGLTACATSTPTTPGMGTRCSYRYNRCGFLVYRVAQLRCAGA
jgi:hypothetical protein